MEFVLGVYVYIYILRLDQLTSYFLVNGSKDPHKKFVGGLKSYV